ncbi:MAG: DUF975 family protein [Lachnospiraceae bacterium]|nr:DUF975 family protein [Lachnospiraceae bacterium]
MFSIKYIWKNAFKALKTHYFMNIIIVFIVSFIVVGGYSHSNDWSSDIDSTMLLTNSIKSNSKIIEEILNNQEIVDVNTKTSTKGQKYTKGYFSVFVNQITASGSLIFGIINGVNQILFKGKVANSITIFFMILLSAFIWIFVKNVIIVGRCRYFLEHRSYSKTKADRILFIYITGTTKNVAKIMLQRSIYQSLWNLTIVGGIIKYYQYRMIPYILAENPNISSKDAFLLSKQIINGNKRNYFLLDLSFLPISLLDKFTMDMTSLFFSNAFKECASAEVYSFVRNKACGLIKVPLKDAKSSGSGIQNEHATDTARSGALNEHASDTAGSGALNEHTSDTAESGTLNEHATDTNSNSSDTKNTENTSDTMLTLSEEKTNPLTEKYNDLSEKYADFTENIYEMTELYYERYNKVSDKINLTIEKTKDVLNNSVVGVKTADLIENIENYNNTILKKTGISKSEDKESPEDPYDLFIDDIMFMNTNGAYYYPDEYCPSPFISRRDWLSTDWERPYGGNTFILFFFFFSLIGWVWEVFFYLINEGIFVNRGTMNGPWLPIYGVGGLIIIYVLKPLRKNPGLMFAGTFTVCGLVEYSAHWLLEVLFDKKWWDYTGYFMNINGRVCLEGLLVFGLAGVAMTYFIAPVADNLLAKIPRKIRALICIILIAAFAFDLVYSIYHPNVGMGVTEGLV